MAQPHPSIRLRIGDTRIVEIEHEGWGARWKFQFPESIASLTGWVMDYQPIAIDWRQAGEQAWAYTWRTDEAYLAAQAEYRRRDGSGRLAHKTFVLGLRLEAEIAPVGPDIRLRLALTNESERPFARVECEGGCLQAQSEAFTGPGEIQRTWIMRGGGMQSLDSLRRTVAERCLYRCHAGDYDRPPWDEGEWFWGRSPDAPDWPVILAMESVDRRRAVAIGYEGAASGAANADAQHHCLHSRPFFDTIAPGETVTRQGWICFGEDLHALGARLRQKLASRSEKELA